MGRRINAFLRSPKTAAWLIALLAAFSAAATVVPQEQLTSTAEIAAWRSANPLAASVVSVFGFDHAFTSLPFLAAVTLLISSTVVCAWDRSRAAIRLGTLVSAPPDLLGDTSRTAAIRVTIPGRGPDEALALSREALSGLSLRVSERGGVLVAVSRLWGSWGSAVFHWALVGLFVAAAAGQAFKWEGQIGVPVGHVLTDSTESYGAMQKGPLAPAAPRTGRSIEVTDLDLDHEVGGAERGHAPYVRMTDAVGSVVAQGFVFPNRPLRDGSLFVHRGPWGLAVVAAIDGEDGSELGRRNYLFDFASTGGTGRLVLEEEMPRETGARSIRLAIPLDGAGDGRFVADLPADPRVELTLVSGSGESSTSVVDRGGSVALPSEGLRLRVVDVTRYARLTVVNDPGILLVYAFLTVACVGCAFALFVRPRVVLLSAAATPEGAEVRAVVIARRIDPLFKERARAALEGLAQREEPS